MNQLKERWGDGDFFLFFVVLSACIVADYLLVRYYERKNARDLSVQDQLKHGSSCLLISYCVLAGYFGSLAFLFLKSFTEFIGSSTKSQQFADENARNWYSYFTLIGVVITNFALEFFRQRGLSYFHAVYVVPINQVVLIVMGTILGGLYFSEFDDMPLLDGAMFCVSILMTVIGVFILAFNSGNLSEKTDAKINHTITLSLDRNLKISSLPKLPNIPSILSTSPSMPITRSVHADIPDLPPPGMAGTIARIHGLHRSMATMHFGKDGKPFYLNPDRDKISVLDAIDNKWRLRRGQSLPTRSSSETPNDHDLAPRLPSDVELGRQPSRSVVTTTSTPSIAGSTALEQGLHSLERIKMENKMKKKERLNTESFVEEQNTV